METVQVRILRWLFVKYSFLLLCAGNSMRVAPVLKIRGLSFITGETHFKCCGKRNRLSYWFHHNNVFGHRDRKCAVTFSKQVVTRSTSHCTGLFVTNCHRLINLKETVAFVGQVISVVFYLINKVIMNSLTQL